MRKLKNALAVAVTLGLITMQQAHAALDAAVTTGITDAKTDILALLSALTAAGIGVFVARVIYRYFKLR